MPELCRNDVEIKALANVNTLTTNTALWYESYYMKFIFLSVNYSRLEQPHV